VIGRAKVHALIAVTLAVAVWASAAAGEGAGSPNKKEANVPSGEAWRKIARFFTPPAKFAGDLGKYKPVLTFYDGRAVKTPGDWSKRREEIRRRWHGIMGPWPELIEKPKLEYVGKARMEGYTRHKVRVQIAADRHTAGYLLVPDGAGPFPAVLTVYYEPETLVGLTDKPGRDFARALARRGFVTLAVGWYPRSRNVRIQPLSFLAYAAANCCNALAGLKQVDADRIGVMGHSYGGKWAMFASCLYDRFAAACWSDPGIVFDETRPNVNYWERWYLGYTPKKVRPEGRPNARNPRTGAYKKLVEAGLDLHELHALMAPRPVFVSGGSEDPPQRWQALNATVAVNRLLGCTGRVGMANRPQHSPRPQDNERAYLFFEHFLKP